jgi:hypothetical protein
MVDDKKEDGAKVFGMDVSAWNKAPDGFVKGGTTTWEHDKKVAKDWQDAEKRRDEAAAEKQIAATPLSAGGGKMYQHDLTTQQEQGLPSAKVLLQFVNSKGEPEYDHGEPLQCLADVIMPQDPAYDGELMLMIICPRCKEKLPADQCIIQIRQSNRSWHLDARKAGEPIMWPDWHKGPDGKLHKTFEMHRSAGVIMDSEKFRCGRCDWHAVIDKNTIRTV